MHLHTVPNRIYHCYSTPMDGTGGGDSARKLRNNSTINAADYQSFDQSTLHQQSEDGFISDNTVIYEYSRNMQR